MPRIYPEGGYANIGDKRWELEYYTMRPGAALEIEQGRDFDPDADTICHAIHFKYSDHEAARSKAQEILNAYEKYLLAFGQVTVIEQRVDWFVEENNLAEWQSVGEPEYFDGVQEVAAV